MTTPFHTHTLLLLLLLLLLPTGRPLLELLLLDGVSLAVNESWLLGVAVLEPLPSKAGDFLGGLFITGVSSQVVPQSLSSCDALVF